MSLGNWYCPACGSNQYPMHSPGCRAVSSGIPDRPFSRKVEFEVIDTRATQKEIERLRKALELAAVRLEILTGRIRACREERGGHDLIEEAEMFCTEARAALTRSPTHLRGKPPNHE